MSTSVKLLFFSKWSHFFARRMLKWPKKKKIPVIYIKAATQVIPRVVVNRYIGRYLAFFISVYPIFQKTFILMECGTFILTALRRQCFNAHSSRSPSSLVYRLCSTVLNNKLWHSTTLNSIIAFAFLLLVTEKRTL